MEYTFRDESERMHDLILRSFRHREALFGLLLAAYRVELTGLLSRAAKTGFEDGDTDTVIELADHIAAAAKLADLSAIRGDALSLRACANAAMGGGEREEGKVLVAGLKLIDRILDTAKERETASKTKPAPLLS
jgi:hypothetical protein